MAGYEPHFDIDYRRGLVGEELVGTFLQALAGSLIEVKTDYRAHETGNVYLETHQKSPRGEWYKSGINATKADWFVYAGPSASGFMVLKTNRLLELAKDKPKVNVNTENENTRATHGRLIKLDDMVKAIFEEKE